MKTKLISNLSLFAVNGAVYGLSALYYCFIQIYIGKFYADDAAGVLLALGPLVSIFAPILWGYLADKAKSKNRVLALTAMGSAVFYFALMLDQSFWYLAVILVLCMFFLSPTAGILDIITLEYTSEHGAAYGPFRITGTFMFGLLPMILTGFTEQNINVIFYAYLVMALIACISALASPKVAGHGSSEHRPSMMAIFHDRRLMLIFLLVGIAQFTWTYYINFFPGHLTGTLGHSEQVWGVNTFLTVLGEVPFFLAFNKLFDKLGIKKLILASAVLVTLRYAGLALLTSVPVLLFIGLLTGFATTVFTYCGSVYINAHVAPENKASANSLMYALGNGIPKVLAGVLGGIMTTGLGYTPSMLICCALCALTVVIYFAAFAREPGIS
ncbi:MAG: MFS transporter [Ruminococcaceae bacterium]|nr:MFS transporter [Oscillospiraceae bacterium]